MHVATKCIFFLINYCKLKIKAKFPQDNQLCADNLPCISFLCDIAVGFLAVVNKTPGIIAPK